MGYTTDFEGRIKIEPPLNEQEIGFLSKFADTRRMNREKGPYYVDGSGMCGDDIIDYTNPPPGQPGLWCQWEASDDGKFIEWDGGEKFCRADQWMKYIIDHFLRPNPIAASKLDFLQEHTCNGTIKAQGEEANDAWLLLVVDNEVSKATAEVTYNEPQPL